MPCARSFAHFLFLIVLHPTVHFDYRHDLSIMTSIEILSDSACSMIQR